MRRKWKSGYSLVEVLIVIALIAVIALVAIPIFSDMLVSYRVSTSVSNMAVQIRFARNACVKRKVPFQIVIREEGGSPPNTYLVQFNESGSWKDVKGLDFTMSSGVKILASSTDGPLVFNSRGGIEGITAPFLINLQAPNQTSYRISIQRNGSVAVTKL